MNQQLKESILSHRKPKGKPVTDDLCSKLPAVDLKIMLSLQFCGFLSGLFEFFMQYYN